jgi:hypothetical protein
MRWNIDSDQEDGNEVRLDSQTDTNGRIFWQGF